ncbi:ANTAR domain-containing protein [Plantactinospora solaniradicis]|uniref:ANTAR domain-containing protein n=1 Tax=Plantactinospora solaniradicis TaxID=1723736 RepID=A0ABW1KPH3_9ACTN
MRFTNSRRCGCPTWHGLLMEWYRLTADQAFILLVRASQHTSIKVAEMARTLAQTGVFVPPSRSGPSADRR